MKTLLMMSLVGALVGCASATQQAWEKRWENWNSLQAGQSTLQVTQAMGSPQEFLKDGEKDIWTWSMDAYEKCSVTLNSAGTVEGKTCQDNAQARAQSQATAFQYMQSRQSGSAFTPMPAYQVPLQQNTHCTSRVVGGISYTDCQGQ